MSASLVCCNFDALQVLNGSVDAAQVLLDHGAEYWYKVMTQGGHAEPLRKMTHHNKNHGAAILELMNHSDQNQCVQAIVSVVEPPSCRSCVLA